LEIKEVSSKSGHILIFMSTWWRLPSWGSAFPEEASAQREKSQIGNYSKML
jgi:hypothetical protein